MFDWLANANVENCCSVDWCHGSNRESRCCRIRIFRLKSGMPGFTDAAKTHI